MDVRYDDMRIDRLLIKDYQRQMEADVKGIKGLNDIDFLLADFEKKFATYIGVQHALAVNSGTDALQLSLMALGVGSGDSVIVPNITYPAVPLSVIYAGAEPIFIDASEDDLEINVKKIEKNIRKDTKAIIAAHMFGRACKMEQISKIAKKHSLYVIEDVCQAESSEYKNKKLGSFGDLSCFSFSYYKPLSSCGGGGGMVCFNDKKHLKIVDYTRMWKDSSELLDAGKRFAKMYLMDLMSLKVKFRYLKDIIKSRLKIKEIYEEGLDGVDGIEIIRDSKNTFSVPQNFLIFCADRDGLGRHLITKNIYWQGPYVPLHLKDIFKRFSSGLYPVSERYNMQAIQLPLYSFMKKDEAEMIVDTIREYRSLNDTTRAS